MGLSCIYFSNGNMIAVNFLIYHQCQLELTLETLTKGPSPA
jgi:hypothetical protein